MGRVLNERKMKRIYIISEFKNKEFYELMIKTISDRIDFLTYQMAGVKALTIKDVVIENPKPFSMHHVHRSIEEVESLEEDLRVYQERLVNVNRWYNMITNDEVKMIVDMLYFKHMPSDTVARSVYRDISSVYRMINRQVDAIVNKEINVN